MPLLLLWVSVACSRWTLLTPWSRVILEKPTGSQLVKKFPVFYGTRRLFTAFIRARHPSLSWASSIHSMPPYPTSWISIRVNISWHDKFLRWGVVSTSPNPQAGGPPLVGCPRLLIQCIHSYPPYWRSFLHPQPESAACHADSDPLVMELYLLLLTA